MKLWIDPARLIIVEHNGEQCTFNTFRIPTKWDTDPERLLCEINGWWATQSDETQQQIFEQYVNIYNILSYEKDDDIILTQLQREIAYMLDTLHPFDDIKAYTDSLGIKCPDNVTAEFEETNERKHRDITYIRDEFYDLVALTVKLRVLFPIWNAYRVLLEGRRYASKTYADVEILRTLRHTQFIGCRAMVRLRDCVDAAYRTILGSMDTDPELSSVIAGLGSSELPFYILGSVLAGKLITTSIVGNKAKMNLLTTIYNKIKQDCANLDGKFSERIRIRDISRLGDEDDKNGYLESWSTRQDVSNEIILTNQVYLENYRLVRHHLDPTIPRHLLAACYESVNKTKLGIIEDHQLLLVQLTLSGLVMPRALPSIRRRAFLSAMAVTQAALVHWGLGNLAMYVTAKPSDDDLTVAASTPMYNLNTALEQELISRFPYFKYVGSKSNTKQYPILTSVNEIAALFADTAWELRCTGRLQPFLPQPAGPLKFDIEFRNQIAKLILIVDKLRYPEY